MTKLVSRWSTKFARARSGLREQFSPVDPDRMHKIESVRVEAFVELGRRPGGPVSEREFAGNPDLIEEFRSMLQPEGGRLFLDGHLGIISGNDRFLGVAYLIENFDTSVILLDSVIGNGDSQEMLLDFGKHALTTSRNSQSIRFEIRRRSTNNVIDGAEFKAHDVAGEWFLGWARLMRIASELGDEFAREQVTASFRGLSSQHQDLIDEGRLMGVLNDPFEKMMRRENDLTH